MEWSGGALAFGDSFDAFYERFGIQSFGNDLAPDTTYYLYIQPTFQSAFTGQREKGTCSEYKVRKEHLAPFQALLPLRHNEPLITYIKEDVNKPDHIGMMMQGNENTFMFSPSEGAVAYQLQIITTDSVPGMIIYDQTRSADHCGIGHVDNHDNDDGLLRWWLSNGDGFDAHCENGEMDAEPELLDFVHTSDLRWAVYAIGADGGRRLSWHSGDEQADAGVSADNREFRWQLASLPPKVGDRLLIAAGFHLEETKANGVSSSQNYDLSKVQAESAPEDGGIIQALRYEQTIHFPSDSALAVSPSLALVTSPPAPVINGVRVWYRRDDQPWSGPFAVRNGGALSDVPAFDVPVEGLTLEMIYQPMEFEWGGPGRDRVVALFATHLVSHLVRDAVPTLEPAQPQPTCSVRPPAPVIDEPFRFDEDDLNGVPCSQFKYSLPGVFGFSWSEVPNAVKYRVCARRLNDGLGRQQIDGHRGGGWSALRVMPIA